jgi:hypothetical protein
MLRAIRSWGIADQFVYRLASSGGDNVRRSWDTFDSSSTGGGLWWGHCHVPSPESHWDPGPLNIGAFFAAGEDDFLMGLTQAQQDDLKADTDWTAKRVAGVLPQHYYVVDDTGAAVSVSADTPGAQPATALDTLDGNYIVRRIDSVSDQIDSLTPVGRGHDYGAALGVAVGLSLLLNLLSLVLIFYPPAR